MDNNQIKIQSCGVPFGTLFWAKEPGSQSISMVFKPDKEPISIITHIKQFFQFLSDIIKLNRQYRQAEKEFKNNPTNRDIWQCPKCGHKIGNIEMIEDYNKNIEKCRDCNYSLKNFKLIKNYYKHIKPRY